MNQNLSKFLKEYGVVHELTCVDTPQQNGVAERKNRRLLELYFSEHLFLDLTGGSSPDCHLFD